MKTERRPETDPEFVETRDLLNAVQQQTNYVRQMQAKKLADQQERGVAQQQVQQNGSQEQQWHYQADGRVDVPFPLSQGQPPVSTQSAQSFSMQNMQTNTSLSSMKAPPPPWLVSEVSALRRKYPSDSFEASMKYAAVERVTNQMLSIKQIPTDGEEPPANMRFQWLPRLKCHDCPGKLYTPGPGTTVENFEIHLRNRLHKERREARVGKEKEEDKSKGGKPKGPVDVEKQCGVVLLGKDQQCARSLTCKSHSMGAKRAVPGRSLPFDVLLGRYYSEKQADKKAHLQRKSSNIPLTKAKE